MEARLDWIDIAIPSPTCISSGFSLPAYLPTYLPTYHKNRPVLSYPPMQALTRSMTQEKERLLRKKVRRGRRKKQATKGALYLSVSFGVIGACCGLMMYIVCMVYDDVITGKGGGNRRRQQ